ncbi:MAG: phosphoenolpyruvate carboxykinase [Bacteriovoracia bacterium]
MAIEPGEINMWKWWNGILSGDINLHINSNEPFLIEQAIKKRQGNLSADGALVVLSGKFTGRAADDKYIVKDSLTEEMIDWGGKVNVLSSEKFQELKTEILSRVHMLKPEMYVMETSAGAVENYSLGVNLITTSPVHALFCSHIMRDRREANPLGEFTIYHYPDLEFDAKEHGLRSSTVIALDFSTKEILIAGTSYCGEIKKSIFTVMNTLLPDLGVLPMHSGANADESNNVSVFFGLSGTGKTTLSTDQGMRMIGDDEHGLSREGIFNFEGGCYAKTYKLKEESEPDIFHATNRFGSIMENVVLDKKRVPDFDDKTITENGRSTYPLRFLDNIVQEGAGKIPSNFFFLSADAMGVLPPLSLLTKEQAMYYFLLGYTAKVAGTEAGMKGISATFSHCFGAPFMMRKPYDYGLLLKDLLQEYPIRVWLVNTGWYGGPYGVGKRFDISVTRSCIRAVQQGKAEKSEFRKDEIFSFLVPETLEGVESKYLRPSGLWKDGKDYRESALNLKRLFDENYKKLLKREENALFNTENISL